MQYAIFIAKCQTFTPTRGVSIWSDIGASSAAAPKASLKDPGSEIAGPKAGGPAPGLTVIVDLVSRRLAAKVEPAA